MIFRNFLDELKRRHVYNVAVAYAVVAWLLIQIATQVFPFFDVPNRAVRLIVLLLLLGFPVAVGLAWAFEITPEGIKRAGEVRPNKSIPLRNCRKLTAVIGIIALLASALLVLQFASPKPASMPPAATTPAPSTAAAPVIPEKSIAVLPFENLSDDKQSAHLADGVQDEILTDLAKIADLKVISRTSVMQYKETAKRNLPEIAQALKVALVLEGSVQRVDNRVRVTAQLIDARTDAHLWAERYDGDLADVFAIQTEIAQKIADQLQAMLSPKEQSAIQAKPTRDLYAHDLYLRATEFAQSSTGDLPEKTGSKSLFSNKPSLRYSPATPPRSRMLSEKPGASLLPAPSYGSPPRSTGSNHKNGVILCIGHSARGPALRKTTIETPAFRSNNLAVRSGQVQFAKRCCRSLDAFASSSGWLSLRVAEYGSGGAKL